MKVSNMLITQKRVFFCMCNLYNKIGIISRFICHKDEKYGKKKADTKECTAGNGYGCI